jgi:hypothetical protein
VIVRPGISPYYPSMWGVFYALGGTVDVDRCPYCAEANGMTPVERYLICAKCGHMELPDHRKFVCSCPKCQKIANSVSYR